VDVDFSFPVPRRSDAEARLCCNARDRNEGVCQELAPGVKESPGCAEAFKEADRFDLGRNVT
jgi:hypothetical protein